MRDPGRRAGQRGDVGLADEVAQERRLGQQLHVEEGGPRLERDRPQRLEPVDRGGRVGVFDRHGEQQPPGPGAQPPRQARRAGCGAAAEGVVAAVDLLEERVEVGAGPRLDGRRHQHQRQADALQGPLQGPGTPLRLLGDDQLRRPAPLCEQVHQPAPDLLGPRRVAAGRHDHPHPGPRRQGLAPDVVGMHGAGDRGLGVGRGHDPSLCGDVGPRRGERGASAPGFSRLAHAAPSGSEKWGLTPPARLRPAAAPASARRRCGRRPGAGGSAGRGGPGRSGCPRSGQPAAPRWSCPRGRPRRRQAARAG